MTLQFAIVLFGAMLAAIVSGSSGFAFALIASAVWMHVLAPSEVVPLVVACSLLVNLVMAWQLRGSIRFGLLWPFLAGAMVGVPIGVAALHSLDGKMVRQGVGLLLILYSSYMLFQPKMPVLRLASVSGKIADGAVGMLGGFMGGATSLNGVFPTLWCGLRGWSKSEQRGVFQPYILIVHATTLAWMGGAGELSRETGLNILLCVPALLIGSWLGLRLFHHVSENGFRKLMLGLFFLSGLALVLSR
ncbi:sulfite exporter TauE/SafE family protein [Herminiimonas contaminans]|uniref:Probable membrane transporter protein n=1 Tax=Herminiimonas contaminans TaxID=1111140 RepID=A0ABS0ESW2_9BURK|nr:sulfite exporter TauE/SafE family protein [Herminiimonas contaminans]MBF8177939.1 sulfite exporter TauE/SafE family protein [Herminiimonas contaminans]